MKYCQKCGAQNEDGVLFCTGCGDKFEVQGENPQPNPNIQPVQYQQQSPQPQYQPPQPQYMPPPYQPPQANRRPLSSNPAINILKQIGSSPLFVTVAIMYSASLLFQVIQIIINASSNPFAQIMSALDSYELYDLIPRDFLYGMEDALYNANIMTVIINIAGLIIPVLIGVGLWMHFFASRDESSDGMKTGGLTIIKICTVINFVFACIFIFFVVIVCILAVIALAGINGDAAQIAAVIILVSVIISAGGASVFVIFYYVKILKSIKAAKMCAVTGTPKYKMSVFVPVMNFISVFFGVIGLFSSIATMYYLGAVAVMSFIITVVLNSAVLITISVAMLSYNSKIQALAYSQNPQPQYPYPPPPVYNQYNQYQNQNRY